MLNERDIETEQLVSSFVNVIDQLKQQGIKGEFELMINHNLDLSAKESSMSYEKNGKNPYFSPWTKRYIESVYTMDYDGKEKNIYQMLGGNPGQAMEKHLEEKYGEEFTLVLYNEGDYIDWAGRLIDYAAVFTTESLPGTEVKATIKFDKKNDNAITFSDNYQSLCYNKKFYEIAQKIVAEKFYGDYFVNTRAERFDDTNEMMMSLSEYTQAYNVQYIEIIVTEGSMDNSDIVDGIRELRRKIEDRAIKAHYYVYINHDMSKTASQAGYLRTEDEKNGSLEKFFEIGFDGREDY